LINTTQTEKRAHLCLLKEFVAPDTTALGFYFESQVRRVTPAPEKGAAQEPEITNKNIKLEQLNQEKHHV